MSTKRQQLGAMGELFVVKRAGCPGCKKVRTFRRLPPNFKCADLICDFCGYLAQVKTANCLDVAVLPKRLLGAAWSVQQARMKSAIYFPLFLVLVAGKKKAIYFLSADLQTPALFKPRRPLSSNARRAGWRGFVYDFSILKSGGFVRINTRD